MLRSVGSYGVFEYGWISNFSWANRVHRVEHCDFVSLVSATHALEAINRGIWFGAWAVFAFRSTGTIHYSANPHSGTLVESDEWNDDNWKQYTKNNQINAREKEKVAPLTYFSFFNEEIAAAKSPLLSSNAESASSCEQFVWSITNSMSSSEIVVPVPSSRDSPAMV